MGELNGHTTANRNFRANFFANVDFQKTSDAPGSTDLTSVPLFQDETVRVRLPAATHQSHHSEAATTEIRLCNGPYVSSQYLYVQTLDRLNLNTTAHRRVYIQVLLPVTTRFSQGTLISSPVMFTIYRAFCFKSLLKGHSVPSLRFIL